MYVHGNKCKQKQRSSSSIDHLGETRFLVLKFRSRCCT